MATFVTCHIMFCVAALCCCCLTPELKSLFEFSECSFLAVEQYCSCAAFASGNKLDFDRCYICMLCLEQSNGGGCATPAQSVWQADRTSGSYPYTRKRGEGQWLPSCFCVSCSADPLAVCTPPLPSSARFHFLNTLDPKWSEFNTIEIMNLPMGAHVYP